MSSIENNLEWEEGYILAQDTHCFVICECGEELSASDHKITVCPNCGNSHFTQFQCFRIPAENTRIARILQDVINIFSPTEEQEQRFLNLLRERLTLG